jgi:hypothetical protein
MRSGAFQCSSPWHTGDRYIASRFDTFERRIEFRRRTDQGRERVLQTGDVCRACMQAAARASRTENATPVR